MEIPEMLKDVINEAEEKFWKQYDSKYDAKRFALKEIALSLHRVGFSRKISDKVIVSFQGMVDKIIESNKDLAQSNNKHSKRMFWLTVVLAVASGVQIFVTIHSLF